SARVCDRATPAALSASLGDDRTAATACATASGGIGRPATTAATSPTAATASAGRRFWRRARTTHRPVILPLCVYPVRNLVVDRDVIHLTDRQRDGLEAPAMIRRQPRAGVVGEPEVVGVLWVDPDVVIVATPRHLDERFSPVGRAKEAAVRDQDLV